MQIYLARPGGEKEGPLTLEQINTDLASGKYSGNDYWAWHEGLPSWMPLHSLPGVSINPATAKPTAVAPAPAPAPTPAPAPAPTPAPAPAAAPAPATIARPVPSPMAVTPTPAPAPVVRAETPKPEPTPAPAPTAAKLVTPAKREPVHSAPATPTSLEPAAMAEPVKSTPPAEAGEGSVLLKPLPSGFPFAALEQIFILTSGEGRSVFESKALLQKIQDTVGEDTSLVREKVAVAVVGKLDLPMEMITDDSLPEKAWRALFAVKPEVAQLAKDGAFQFCVRKFLAESNEVMTLLLLYNKQRM